MNPDDPLANLENPINADIFSTYIHKYEDAVTNNVNTGPRLFNITKPCLVCGETGQTCGILNNLPFLQWHYISWKLYLAKAHKREAEIKINSSINRLETQY